MRFLDALIPPREVSTRSISSFQDYVDALVFQGNAYGPFGMQTTYGLDKADPVADSFISLSQNGLKGSAPVAAVERVRVSVFSEARFQYQRMRDGKPGELFGDKSLQILERPWVGGTTGDLLGRMILDADFAGNSFHVLVGNEIVRLRPDWVDILLADRIDPISGDAVGFERVGYVYHHGGKGVAKNPKLFDVSEVSHFAPNPDPLATYSGMSWLTAVIREIQADKQATKHKLKFFENAATPNLAVSMAKEVTPEQFEKFIKLMDAKHKGVENAYKTLYTAGGANVTVVGADLKQLDFKATQGAGETRIASNAGIHPVVAMMSEGMQGSSLNAGNFGAARRVTADTTFRPLWRNAAGSLEILLPVPADARLWFDESDVGFLREDRMDQAEIQNKEAQTVRTLLDAGYEGQSVVAAVVNQDWSLLKHSGLFSVQLQPPGTTQAPAPAEPAEE